jgi:hypothetical protein
VAIRIQLRRDTAANWTSYNPILRAGEVGVETDTQRLKVGDGSSAWLSRPYINVLPSELRELAQDNVNEALTAGNGITKVYDDLNNTITISVDTSIIANRSYVDAAVANVLDSAPEVLNTLNELAAAIGDDPAFFTTVANNLSTHQSDTTNIHGIADTSKLVTDDGAQTLTNKSLTSPTLTGVPTAPTATAGTNTTQVATTEFVKTAVDNLVDGAPALLDTLNEISAAINDDPAFFSNVATNLASHEADTTNIHGIANTAKLVTDDGNQSLTNKTISGSSNLLTNIGNASLVNPSITINGVEIFLGGSANYDTDDIVEGTNNLYFTAERAQDAVAAAILAGTHQNLTVSYDDNLNKISFVAENGVADSTTDDLDEGTTNLYFTDQRAINAVGGSATSADVPNTVVKRNALGDFAAGTVTADLVGNVTGTVSAIDNHTTTGLPEGDNLYFTGTRVRDEAADTLLAGNGIDIEVDPQTKEITISGEIASTGNAGIAFFHEADFTVDQNGGVNLVPERIQDIAAGATAAGEAIDVFYDDVNNQIIVSAEDATYTNKGVATFDSTDFVVTNGNVELNSEGVTQIVGDMISSNTESGISVTFDGINNKLDFNVNDPTITLSGDVAGSATMTNLGNVEISTSIQPNSVSLGTDTTGNYVQDITGTVNEITVSGSGSESASVVIGLPDTVHITDDLQVGGDTTIVGNLTVQGTTTTITSQNLAITDKLIELGNTASPTDAAADGGGIFLHGTTDKHLAWYDAADAWTSSENFDLHVGKVYMIDETEVLSNNELFGINKDNIGKFTAKPEASWQGTDVLRIGEIGLESDTGNFKIGDGTSTWSALNYVNVTPSDLSNTVGDYIPLADRGVNDGVAAINSTGEVLSLSNFVANSDATTGAPSGNYGLIVKRGNQPDALLIWNETLDRWTYSNDGGTNNYVIASEVFVSSSVSTHNADTTDVHGISDTANLVYQVDLDAVELAVTNSSQTYTNNQISLHNNDTTNVHGITDTADLAYQADLVDAVTTLNTTIQSEVTDLEILISETVTNHSNDSTSVHGIADTAALATFTYVDNKVTTDIATHNNDTTNVHGIPDTSLLATISYVNQQASSAESDAAIYTDAAIVTLNTQVQLDINQAQSDAETAASFALSQEVTARSQAIATSVNNHNNSTTSVHGIADTSALATKTYADNAVSTHSLDTTAVHGIADTAQLATKTYADNSASISAGAAQSAAETFATGAVTTHNSDTTDVHGISNTANLVYTNDARLSDTRTPTDGSVTATKLAADSVTNNAIAEGSISITKITNLEDDLAAKSPSDSPVFTGTVSLPSTTTIGLVDGTEIGYLNGVTSNIQTQLTTNADEIALKANIASPTFTGVPAAPTASAGTNTTQIATTAYVRTEVSNLINSAPTTLDTLNELAAALNNDASFATTITAAVGLKAPLASPTFTGTVTLPNSTITTVMLANGSVTAEKIFAGTITNAEISASAAIDQSKISGLTTALNLKAPLASPTFTGSVTVPAPTADTHAATKAYVDSKAQDIIPLDNLNSQFDGSRSRFQPKLNNEAVTITNPLRLLISINGIIQILGNPDNHWLSPIPFDGFYVDSDGYLNFGEPVPKGSVFDGRVMNGPAINSVDRFKYPFRPIDILLGA